VAEFDDDEITTPDSIGDSIKVTFDGVGACGSSGYGIIDNGDVEGVFEPLAPT
jgi:hypothetical protein